MSSKTIFYQDKPIFGLDVGSDSLRVLQVDWHKGKPRVVGYGVSPFEVGAVKDGIIVDFDAVAKSAKKLFESGLVGDITTRRVAISIASDKSYTQNFRIPQVDKKDLDDAVLLEIEEYVPVPMEHLYFDKTIVSSDENNVEIISVAVPKKIVDSFVVLAEILGLELVTIEPATMSAGRLFLLTERSDVPTILIDLGAWSSDITIYDKNLIVTGSAPGGGQSFTKAIAEKLSITETEAHVVKTKYGLGLSKKQREITDALTPTLDGILKETKRMLRYYEERSGSERKIDQVITMGGGANMPGLSDHMTNLLRLPVKTSDPWNHFTFHGLKPPNPAEKTMYVTAAGLAIINPRKIFV